MKVELHLSKVEYRVKFRNGFEPEREWSEWMPLTTGMCISAPGYADPCWLLEFRMADNAE